MAQFDPLIIFSLIWSLIFILILYYNLSIKILIPNFFGTKKFREKKLNLANSNLYTNLNKNEFVKVNKSYNFF